MKVMMGSNKYKSAVFLGSYTSHLLRILSKNVLFIKHVVDEWSEALEANNNLRCMHYLAYFIIHPSTRNMLGR